MMLQSHTKKQIKKSYLKKYFVMIHCQTDVLKRKEAAKYGLLNPQKSEVLTHNCSMYAPRWVYPHLQTAAQAQLLNATRC